MTEHDARSLAPKNRPADDLEALAEFARSHWFCAACGAESYRAHTLTIHHLIGGRGGRSDEHCNLLMLGWEPCHLLAEGLDVRQPWRHLGVEKCEVDDGRYKDCLAPLLPKITLGIALSLKARAGELSAADLDRLTALHGRNLPEPAEIPAFFVELFRRNRPELNRGGCDE